MVFSPIYLVNSAPKIAGLVAYGALNLLLFALGARGQPDPVQALAVGTGLALQLNCALLLVPMMRLFVSRLRRLGLGEVLPLEKATNFHRLVGHVVLGLAVLHTVAYVAHYRQLGLDPATIRADPINQSGAVVLLLYGAVWVFSLARVRRRRGFYEVFLISHMLAVPFVAVMFAHSTWFAVWLFLPGAGYVADRAVRFHRMRTPARLVGANTLPSEVIELVIERPEGFRYRPGDYVFLLVPLLSRFEWHALTISSPPEDPRHLTFHVRSLGDWSGMLYDVFSRFDAIGRCDPAPFEGLLPRRKLEVVVRARGRLQVFMDGPHGTPSNDIFGCETAVLVCAGIGVTPFASILRSLVARSEGPSIVYFWWVNRDHRAFEWFIDLVEALHRDHGERFRIALHVTGPPDTEPRLPELTHLGRPDFGPTLDAVAAEHGASDTTVFYCGPRALGGVLKGHCRALGLRYRKENF